MIPSYSGRRRWRSTRSTSRPSITSPTGWRPSSGCRAAERQTKTPGPCSGVLPLVAFALQALAHQLAGPADRLGPLARAALGRLLVVAAELHLAEDPFALHLLLQDAQRLIDIVFTNENLHFDRFLPGMSGHPPPPPRATS